MRNNSHRFTRSVHQVNATASFVLLVGLALGAIVVAGIGRVVGWGACP